MKIKKHAQKHAFCLVTSAGQNSNFLKKDIEIILNKSFHIRRA